MLLSLQHRQVAYEWQCANSLSRMSTDYKMGNMATFYFLPPTLPIATGHAFPPTTLGPGTMGPPVCMVLPVVFHSSTAVGGGHPIAD